MIRAEGSISRASPTCSPGGKAVGGFSWWLPGESATRLFTGTSGHSHECGWRESPSYASNVGEAIALIDRSDQGRSTPPARRWSKTRPGRSRSTPIVDGISPNQPRDPRANGGRDGVRGPRVSRRLRLVRPRLVGHGRRPGSRRSTRRTVPFGQFIFRRESTPSSLSTARRDSSLACGSASLASCWVSVSGSFRGDQAALAERAPGAQLAGTIANLVLRRAGRDRAGVDSRHHSYRADSRYRARWTNSFHRFTWGSGIAAMRPPPNRPAPVPTGSEMRFRSFSHRRPGTPTAHAGDGVLPGLTRFRLFWIHDFVPPIPD